MIITYLEDGRGKVIDNLDVLQYYFKHGERTFKIIIPHGNKKDKKDPFSPVSFSTNEQIKAQVRVQKPTKVMGKLSNQTNLLNANSKPIPRDLKQLKYF